MAWDKFYCDCPGYNSVLCVEIYILKLLPHLLGANGLRKNAPFTEQLLIKWMLQNCMYMRAIGTWPKLIMCFFDQIKNTYWFKRYDVFDVCIYIYIYVYTYIYLYIYIKSTTNLMLLVIGAYRYQINVNNVSKISCQKGPTRHANADRALLAGNPWYECFLSRLYGCRGRPPVTTALYIL